MARTFLDNIEEAFFKKVNNEEELIKLLKKAGANEDKIKIVLDYYTIYLQKEQWLLSKMRKSSDTLIVKNLNTIDECITFINQALNQNKKYTTVLIYLDNKDYPDLDKLNKLNIPFYIVTNNTFYNIEQFNGMRETINYYKSLTTELSPLEQVTYIYDLIKSFPYKETNNKEESRYIKHIIEGGNIVCVGYTNLICQILSELGFKCYRVKLTNINNTGHERIIVKINDEKYNINGLFAFDATFDSASDLALSTDESGKTVYRNTDNPIKTTDKVIKKYDNLILYKYFLIPLIEYGIVFPKEKIKTIEEYSQVKPKVIGDTDYYNMLQTKHVDKRNINLEMFIILMYNVKINEGYNIDTIYELINDIITVNNFSNKNEIELIKQVISKLQNIKK